MKEGHSLCTCIEVQKKHFWKCSLCSENISSTNFCGSGAVISLIAQEVHKSAWHCDSSVSYCWNDFTAVKILPISTVLPCSFRLNWLGNIMKPSEKANFLSHSLFGNSNWE